MFTSQTKEKVSKKTGSSIMDQPVLTPIRTMTGDLSQAIKKQKTSVGKIKDLDRSLREEVLQYEKEGGDQKIIEILKEQEKKETPAEIRQRGVTESDIQRARDRMEKEKRASLDAAEAEPSIVMKNITQRIVSVPAPITTVAPAATAPQKNVPLKKGEVDMSMPESTTQNVVQDVFVPVEPAPKTQKKDESSNISELESAMNVQPSLPSKKPVEESKIKTEQKVTPPTKVPSPIKEPVPTQETTISQTPVLKKTVAEIQKENEYVAKERDRALAAKESVLKRKEEVIPKEIEILEKQRAVVIIKGEELEERVGPLLERDRSLEEEERVLEKKDNGEKNIREHRALEKKRWALEDDRQVAEKERWSIDKDIIQNHKDQEVLAMKINAKKAENEALGQQLSQVQEKREEAQREIERSTIEPKLAKVKEEKDHIEVEWIVLDEDRQKILNKLLPIQEKETLLGKKRATISEAESSATTAVKMHEAEKNRWSLEEEWRPLEESRWAIEEEAEKYSVMMKDLRSRYRAVLADEEKLMKLIST